MNIIYEVIFDTDVQGHYTGLIYKKKKQYYMISAHKSLRNLN